MQGVDVVQTRRSVYLYLTLTLTLVDVVQTRRSVYLYLTLTLTLTLLDVMQTLRS